MIHKIVALWSWFIDGLADAAITCAAVLSKRKSVELIIGSEPPVLREESGKEIGRIMQLSRPTVVDPIDLPEKLAGAQLDVIVPDALVLHRKLNPLPAESEPFLDTFVRHHIERITPWKAADTYFGVTTTRIAGKPPRIAVSVHVAARCLLDDAVAAARELHPARLRLLLPTHEDRMVAVAIDDSKAQRTKIRAIVQATTAGVIILIVCRLALMPTQMAAVQSQTADVDSQIEDQESTLAALRGGSGHFAVGDLLALREARPRVVETLEALSAALPDDDYLASLQIANDDLYVSGISTETSDLVPSLEGSGHFRDVSFVEPITRVQSGEGNKFQLSMRIVMPSKAIQR